LGANGYEFAAEAEATAAVVARHVRISVQQEKDAMHHCCCCCCCCGVDERTIERGNESN